MFKDSQLIAHELGYFTRPLPRWYRLLRTVAYLISAVLVAAVILYALYFVSIIWAVGLQ